MAMNPRLLRPLASGRFGGGDLAVGSLYEAALLMAKGSPIAPTAGGTLTVDEQSLGSYDYAIRSGGTLSSFSESDWFTDTEDTRSGWCVVRGDLTIDSGVTFTPTKRKLFTVLVVTGNLTVNGTLSMTARGANHSGTGNSGGATSAAAIRIINGTYSGVTDPEVPAAGGAGGPRKGGISTSSSGGVAGTAGGCGGGGSGGSNTANNTTSGSGAAGTSFGGGPGGGAGAGNFSGQDATANGGTGGTPTIGLVNSAYAGGAGNPPGQFGGTGTGGVLIVVVLGQLLGSGSVAANGVSSPASNTHGGGSGGGSVTVLAKSDASSITPSANAGNGGGAGTARKLSI